MASGVTKLIPNYPNRPPLPGWQDSDPLSHSIPAYFLQAEGGAVYNGPTPAARRGTSVQKPVHAMPISTVPQFGYGSVPNNSFMSNRNHGWFAPFEYVPIAACHEHHFSNVPLYQQKAQLH